jgi:formylglycine-generating enzyme required for sulfatase activity
METTEVSYAQYMAFMNAMGPGSHRNGCEGQPCMQTRNESETSNIQFDGANYSVLLAINDYPMANVTWYGADAYCKAIGRRLPTEAEWEHAARGPDNNIFPWGNTWDPNNASTRRPASGEPATVPVNSFPGGGTQTGILNLAGNVAEWVSDWYDPRFYGRPEATIADPKGPSSGTEKVVRGGSWDALPFFARSVHRQSHDPLDPQAWIGFRCVDDGSSQAQNNSPLGANTNNNGSDIPLPTASSLGGNEENTAGNNSQPTLPPAPTLAPTRSGTQPTLVPGG